MRAPQGVPRVQVTKLHPENGGVHRVQPLVPTDGDMLVLLALAEITQDADPVRESGVVRNHRPGVAVGAQVLPGVEAEGGDVAERPTSSPVVRSVIAFPAATTSIWPYSSQSTKTGFAPIRTSGRTVAMNVFTGAITSSPALIPTTS